MAKAMPAINEETTRKRRRPFIDAATEAFFANGYGDATMSSIALAVGGSKTTLWNYFPSKEALFAAVVDDIIARHSEVITVELPRDEEVDRVLKRFGTVLMAALLSEPLLNLQRLVIGESRRFPHLAEFFYERGPRRGRALLAAYLDELMEKGDLRRGDPWAAAHQFVALCQSRAHQYAIMNLIMPDQAAQAACDVELAVETFCRGWAKP